jgi:hypothetical protein
MSAIDQLRVLIAVGIGFVVTIAMWLSGIVIANGFAWPW